MASLPRPTLKVSLPRSPSVVLAPGPAPAPVLSPAVASAPESSPPLPGSRQVDQHLRSSSRLDLHITISASRGAATAVPLAVLFIVARFEPVNLPVSQDSRLSSVLLSPNQVRQYCVVY